MERPDRDSKTLAPLSSGPVEWVSRILGGPFISRPPIGSVPRSPARARADERARPAQRPQPSARRPRQAGQARKNGLHLLEPDASRSAANVLGRGSAPGLSSRSYAVPLVEQSTTTNAAFSLTTRSTVGSVWPGLRMNHVGADRMRSYSSRVTSSVPEQSTSLHSQMKTEMSSAATSRMRSFTSRNCFCWWVRCW